MQLYDRRYFGLLGEVVDGNPTQEMMEAAFAAAGLAWKYISIPVPSGDFPQAFEATRRLRFSGLHITKPYKIDAVAAVDYLTPAAAKIGAVNCVYTSGARLIGDNTDGRGLVNALSGLCPLVGASAVVLGAGGAARAIAIELSLAGAADVVIVNRTERSGLSLVEALKEAGQATCSYRRWSGYKVPAGTDLLVNATSIGMLDPQQRPDVEISALASDTVVADAVIAPEPTGFLVDAGQKGLQTVEGTEMLVKQAAISFKLWTGRDADEAELRIALAEALLPQDG